MLDHPDANRQTEPTIDSVSGLLLIMFAKALGYVVLLGLLFIIARQQAWQLTPADLLFWSCAIGIPLARQHVSSRYDVPVAGRAPVSIVHRIGTHLLPAAVLWAGAQSVQILA